MIVQNNPYQNALQSICGYGQGFSGSRGASGMCRESNYSMPFAMGNQANQAGTLPDVIQQLTGLVQSALQVVSNIVTQLTGILTGKEQSPVALSSQGLLQPEAAPAQASQGSSLSDIFGGITKLFGGEGKKESSDSGSSWWSGLLKMAGSFFGALF